MTMRLPNLPARTILPVELQLARCLGLVKRVRIIPLPQKCRWGLLIEGRGFKRLLDAELPDSPGLLRPVPLPAPIPRAFFSKEHAKREAKRLGLSFTKAQVPRKKNSAP